jgi:hypothetical protein
MGMADGRCLSSFDSTNIVNDIIMQKNGIAYQDNYAYRQFLQNHGPEALNLPLHNAACRSGRIAPLAENE